MPVMPGLLDGYMSVDWQDARGKHPTSCTFISEIVNLSASSSLCSMTATCLQTGWAPF